MARLSAVESFEFSNSPGLYSYGFEFSRDQEFIATGAAWYFIAGGPTTLTAYLYDATTQAVLASGTVSTSGWSAGWNDVPFDVEYEGAPETDYVIAVEADGDSAYSNSASYPVEVSGFVITEDRYLSGGGYPSTSWTGAHSAGLAWEEVPAAPVATLHVRTGGALVASSTSGVVRVGGVAVPFGPPDPEPAEQWYEWGLEPGGVREAQDNTEIYNMGVRFYVLNPARPIVGIRLYVPAGGWGPYLDRSDLPALTDSPAISAWQSVDTTTPVRQEYFTPTVLDGGWINAYFADPIIVDPESPDYLVAVTRNIYPHWPQGIPSTDQVQGDIHMYGGIDQKTLGTSRFVCPNATFNNAHYYVSPILGPPA